MGQTGPLGDVRRLRQPGRRASPASRTSAAGPTGRRPGRSAPTPTTSRRASSPSPILAALEHRRRTGEGQLHRPVAGRGVAALPRPGAARLHRQRPRARARRQPRSATARRTASIRPPATTAGWRSRCDGDAAVRGAVRRDGAARARGRCALRDRRRPPGARGRRSTPRSRPGRARTTRGAVERRCRRAASPASARAGQRATCAAIRSSPTAGTSSPSPHADLGHDHRSRARASGSPARRRASPDAAPTYGRDNGARAERPPRLRRSPHHRARRERGPRLTDGRAPARRRGRAR